METLIAPAINLAILVGFMFWKLRQPTKDFVGTRHAFVRDEVSRVEQQLRTAEEKFAEFAAKLKAVDAEVTAIRDQSRQEAEASRLRISNDAKRLAASIVSDAQSTSQSVFNDLRGQLRRELGNRVLDRAETIIRERLTSDDRVRIRRNFSRQVEAIQ